MKLWSITSGEVVRVFNGHERGLACVLYLGNLTLPHLDHDSTDSTAARPRDIIASGSNDKTIKLWDSETGECLLTLEGHTDLIRTLAYDPKSRRLISGSYDATVRIWDLYDFTDEDALSEIVKSERGIWSLGIGEGDGDTEGRKGKVIQDGKKLKPLRSFETVHNSMVFDVAVDSHRIMRYVAQLDFQAHEGGLSSRGRFSAAVETRRLPSSNSPTVSTSPSFRDSWVREVADDPSNAVPLGPVHCSILPTCGTYA